LGRLDIYIINGAFKACVNVSLVRGTGSSHGTGRSAPEALAWAERGS
jgi:hypothetical protein